MQFSWAESSAMDGESEVKGGDFTTYENLYGNELQLFESFFNGNLNELDYLSDLSLPAGSESHISAEPIDLPFVKNEPSSPESFATESTTPSSPGESSGPSSPETLFQHHASMMSSPESTINPISLTMASAYPIQDPLVEIKKQGAKRARFGSEDEDVALTPLPSSGVPEEERHVKRQRRYACNQLIVAIPFLLISKRSMFWPLHVCLILSSLNRLIKNRESAQKSRLRKKMYIEDLETKVKSLATHNDMLLQENNTLKEEINYLTKFINKTPGLAEEIAQSRPKGTAPIRNVKAAGVCLLIVLFSFGLFFNNVQQFGDNGPALPFEGGAREPVPEVLPFGGERRYVLSPWALPWLFY